MNPFLKKSNRKLFDPMFIGVHTIDYGHFMKMAEDPRFRSKLLTSREMKYLMGKGFSSRIIAEMYCIKLAFIKAMGGTTSGCRVSELSVLQDYSGLPYVAPHGVTKQKFNARQCKIAVSFSHNRRTCTAVVLLYPDKK
jgi:phosphopantetheine--protein transferase-like protein